MTKKRVKQQAIEHPVPQSLEECADFIARIGELQRERTIIETAMNTDLAARKLCYEQQAKPHSDAILELSKGVHTWCEANRARLTQDGKVKHHRFASGEVKWRKRPPSIVVRGVDAVIELLKSLGLSRFVRTKDEIDREAMLKEPAVAKTVPGVSISEKEDFAIEPFETQLEEVL